MKNAQKFFGEGRMVFFETPEHVAETQNAMQSSQKQLAKAQENFDVTKKWLESNRDKKIQEFESPATLERVKGEMKEQAEKNCAQYKTDAQELLADVDHRAEMEAKGKALGVKLKKGVNLESERTEIQDALARKIDQEAERLAKLHIEANIEQWKEDVRQRYDASIVTARRKILGPKEKDFKDKKNLYEKAKQALAHYEADVQQKAAKEVQAELERSAEQQKQRYTKELDEYTQVQNNFVKAEGDFNSARTDLAAAEQQFQRIVQRLEGERDAKIREVNSPEFLQELKADMKETAEKNCAQYKTDAQELLADVDHRAEMEAKGKALGVKSKEGVNLESKKTEIQNALARKIDQEAERLAQEEIARQKVKYEAYFKREIDSAQHGAELSLESKGDKVRLAESAKRQAEAKRNREAMEAQEAETDLAKAEDLLKTEDWEIGERAYKYAQAGEKARGIKLADAKEKEQKSKKA